MKRISLFAVLFLMAFSLIFAQESTSKLIDTDKEHYEKDVFNKELGDVDDTLNAARKLYDRIPEKLPDWVFNPIVIGDKIQVVGLSDPNMDKNQAYEQAVLRAKAIYAIFTLSAVSNITDDYTNLHESGKYSLYSTKFQDFSLSKAEFAYSNSTVEILDTFFTKYGEGIALVEINIKKADENNTDTLLVKGEHLQVFIERNFRKEKIEFFNFYVKDKQSDSSSIDLVSQYNFKRVNRSYDISSIYGDGVIEFEERTYNYRSEMDFVKDSTDSELNIFSLNRGLWNAYITGVLSNITVLSKQLSSKVKNSNDFYTLKNEGLIRTVARNKLSFGFNDFKMYENHLYIDLNGQIHY